MANAIFNVFFKVISTIVGILTAPINLIIINFLPNLADSINQFNSIVTNLLGGGLGFFSHLLPPITRATILIWFSVVIAFYTISFAVHLIVKTITIIKNVKFW